MCQEETNSSNFMQLMRTSCHGIEQSQIPITSKSDSIQATVEPTTNIDKAHIDMTPRVVNARGSYYGKIKGRELHRASVNISNTIIWAQAHLERYSDNNRTISSFPFSDATWDGVLPSESSASTSAPCANRTRAASSFDGESEYSNDENRCNGVWCLLSRVFGFAPCSSNNRTILG